MFLIKQLAKTIKSENKKGRIFVPDLLTYTLQAKVALRNSYTVKKNQYTCTVVIFFLMIILARVRHCPSQLLPRHFTKYKKIVILLLTF